MPLRKTGQQENNKQVPDGARQETKIKTIHSTSPLYSSDVIQRGKGIVQHRTVTDLKSNHNIIWRQRNA
jgi:hypothetical protein